MGMQVFLVIVWICICASAIHGSKGYIIDRSPAHSPTHPYKNERKSDFSYHEKTMTSSKSSSPPLADDSSVSEVNQMAVKSMTSMPPTFSPPHDLVIPSMTSQGLSPHVAQSISHGSSQGPVKSLPSMPPFLSPPSDVATPPKASQVLPPHMLPNISHSTSPATSEEPVKSMPSIPPAVSPPSNVEAPPKAGQGLPHILPNISHSMAPDTNQEPVKSTPSISPTMSPPSNIATPPESSQVLPPHLLPNISRSTKPNDTQSPVKSLPPIPSIVSPPSNLAPPPKTIQGLPPHMLPNISHSASPNTSQEPIRPMPSIPPTVSPPSKVAMPPKTSQGFPPHMLPNSSHSMAPDTSREPVKPTPSFPPTVSPPRNVATPPKASQELPPHMLPNVSHGTAPDISPAARPLLPEPAVIPISARPPSSIGNQYSIPAAAPSKGKFLPTNHSHTIGASPVVSPMPQKGIEPGHNALPPNKRIPKQLPRKWFHSPASSPSASSNDHSSAVVSSPAPGPSYPLPRPNFVPRAPSEPPTRGPGKSRQMHHNPPTAEDGPSASPPSSFPSIGSSVSPVASPPSAVPSGETRRPVLSPKISPFGSYTKNPKAPLPAQVLILPPPPPNRDCSSLTCTEPLTNRPPGAPCGCVVPMRVGLQLSVALYTFFPLVSELAKEIASGVFMKQSQVRITGANAASLELDKTVVFIDLVPLGDNFDASLALLTYNRFWHKQVIIQRSFFGEYQVLYVNYSGLPPSPPSAPLSVSTIDGGPHFGKDNSATMLHPLGVDVKKNQKDGLNGSMIAVIVLSSSIALGLCIGVAWLLLLKGAKGNADRNGCLPKLTSPTSGPSSVKPTGGVGSKTFESGPSSAAASFSSSIAAYAGTAKTFTLGEMERATNNFDSLTILGEGGFGRVYRGVLDDGTKVAIKVLKRDDHQGGREFMAEVEMLSRLHHRNLVKLIGICIEGHARCLVYELIPNDSLESHLHGVDKGTAPLDWGARMKIALGAARGLAYLHEDSSPRVIHRDFKASNILLEDDYTPKVSDFGLARAALDEESKHISTRVMGTFGYVAPEYAMTGHLLVKSDVYSYGVVLLELLTGRKPVDMSQPPGQENLVAWARPLLTSKEGLEMIIDPSLGSGFPFDCVAKVAAIASMCVQPEVSHRPFMGEVVQALKLVCEECEETRELGSECFSQDDSSPIDKDSKVATTSGHTAEQSGAHHPMLNYFTLDNQRALSASDIFNRSATFGRQTSGSFRRHSNSGPLSSWRSKQIWDRIRGTSRGSVSEHGFAFKFWPRSH